MSKFRAKQDIELGITSTDSINLTKDEVIEMSVTTTDNAVVVDDIFGKGYVSIYSKSLFDSYFEKVED